MEHIKDAIPSLEEFLKVEPQLRSELLNWGKKQIEIFEDPLLTGLPAGSAGTVLSLGNPIPSKRVLDASAITKKLAGFKIPPKIIKKGGYETSEEFVDNIVSKMKKVVTGEIKITRKKKSKKILVS